MLLLNLSRLSYLPKGAVSFLGGKDEAFFSSASPTEMIAARHQWQGFHKDRQHVWRKAASYCVLLNYTCTPGGLKCEKIILPSLLSLTQFAFKNISRPTCFVFLRTVSRLRYFNKPLKIWSEDKKVLKHVSRMGGGGEAQLGLMSSIYSLSNLEKTMLFHKVA